MNRLSRVLMLAALMCPAIADAGLYRVNFAGSVTEIDSDVPAGFALGDRISGSFLYDPTITETIKQVYTFRSISSGLLNGGEYTNYPNTFPADELHILTQLFPSGPLVISSEGGFRAYDYATEFMATQQVPPTTEIRFQGGSSNTGSALGTRALWHNWLFGDDLPPLS